VNDILGFILFLFAFYFIFLIFLYLIFGFILLFLILDLDKEYNMMLHVIVIQVTRCDGGMIPVTVIVTQLCDIKKNIKDLE